MKSRVAALPIAHCLLCIACCLLLFSCYTPRYVYSPSAHNVPVLLKKGDSKIAANYSANLAGNTHRSDVVTRVLLGVTTYKALMQLPIILLCN
ncbi:MAG: hypothetical protein WDM90_17465 [Ferruginibacter sp.]